MTTCRQKSRSKTLEKPAKDKETIRKSRSKNYSKNNLGETNLGNPQSRSQSGSLSAKEERQQQQLTSFFTTKS